MPRTYLLYLSLLLVTAAGNAQLFSSKTWEGDTGKINLRMNVLGLADVLDGNASVGGEMRFNKTWSVIMDAGYIFYSAYLNKVERTSGIILRPGVRLYAGKYRNVFIDLQFHYKGVRYYVNDWLGKDMMNNVASYQERKVFQDRKRVYGGHIIVGGKEFISANYRWFLEFYLGFGLHYKEESLHGEPDSQYDQGFGIFRAGTLTQQKSTMVTPAFPVGIRLVYTIR
jgi:hypothetical protein